MLERLHSTPGMAIDEILKNIVGYSTVVRNNHHYILQYVGPKRYCCCWMKNRSKLRSERSVPCMRTTQQQADHLEWSKISWRKRSSRWSRTLTQRRLSWATSQLNSFTTLKTPSSDHSKSPKLLISLSLPVMEQQEHSNDWLKSSESRKLQKE